MAFEDILKEMVEGVKGGTGAAIMGMDGLSIQNYIRQDSPCDIETVGVEYGKAIEEVKRASGMLRLGEVEEIRIHTTGGDVLIRILTPEYYMAFVVNHRMNVGKASYLLKKASLRVRKELLK